MNATCEKVIVSTIQEAEQYINGHILFDFYNSDEGITFAIIKDNRPFRVVLDKIIYTYLPPAPDAMFLYPVARFTCPEARKPTIEIWDDNGMNHGINFNIIKNDVCEEYLCFPIPQQDQPVYPDTLTDFLSALGWESDIVELKTPLSNIQHGFTPKENGFIFERKNTNDSAFTNTIIIPGTVNIDNQPKDINIIFQYFVGYV